MLGKLWMRDSSIPCLICFRVCAQWWSVAVIMFHHPCEFCDYLIHVTVYRCCCWPVCCVCWWSCSVKRWIISYVSAIFVGDVCTGLVGGGRKSFEILTDTGKSFWYSTFWGLEWCTLLRYWEFGVVGTVIGFSASCIGVGGSILQLNWLRSGLWLPFTIAERIYRIVTDHSTMICSKVYGWKSRRTGQNISAVHTTANYFYSTWNLQWCDEMSTKLLETCTLY